MTRSSADDARIVSLEEYAGQAIAKRETRNSGIEVSHASLEYPIGPYVRSSLKSGLLRLFGGRAEAVSVSHVEALKDLNLSFAHGERVGVIGRNGSGKSTFLRMLAGIYPLRSGNVRVVGTVGTLLDIGLGFESEATGRENIYYRAMAMGMSRKETKRFEEEIVQFTGLGEFIDLPIRTYSAGMQVRLGFAVSTQFSPDVLLIDEVFGAGDAAFAERAVKRMMQIVRHAGIVIMATHDLSLAARICTRIIWFDQGRVHRDGSPEVVIPQFQQRLAAEG